MSGLRNSVQKSLSIPCFTFVVFTLTGCLSYTKAPVCNGQNTVRPPGLSGTYQLSVGEEDYSVKPYEYDVTNYAEHYMQITDKRDGSTYTSNLCQVNGMLISENYDKEEKLYHQVRLTVDGFGINFSGIYYNKTALDEAGIPNEIIVMPRKMPLIFGLRLDGILSKFKTSMFNLLDEEPITRLVIDNSATTSSTLMKASYSPFGISLQRK